MTKKEAATLPDPELEVHMSNLWVFFRYIQQRQEAWYNRHIKKAPKPWCDDKLINTYKFCNVYRELDKTSQWLIKNVHLNNSLSQEDVIFSILVYRLYNKVETFEHIKIPSYNKYVPDRFTNDLIALYNSGVEPTNRKAYSVNTYMWKGKSFENYAKTFVPQLHERVPRIMSAIRKDITTPQDIIDIIQEIHGLGIFIAHEYFLDFTYMRRYISPDAFPFTEDDWTAVLPGSAKGIRYLFPAMRGKSRLQGFEVLRDISAGFFNDLGGFKYLDWDSKKGYHVTDNKNFTLHQIEFNLCEFQKYQKVTHDIGRKELFTATGLF